MAYYGIGNYQIVLKACSISDSRKLQTLCFAGQVQYNTTSQNKGQFRILINRPSKTGVFSGDFNHGANQSDNAVATLNRTFSGSAVGLEVFSVASELLSPAQLCASLKDTNEGGSLLANVIWSV